jgi:hypothetical protein
LGEYSRYSSSRSITVSESAKLSGLTDRDIDKGEDTIGWERDVHDLGVRATLMEYGLEDSEPGDGTTGWAKRAVPGFITVDGVREPVG